MCVTEGETERIYYLNGRNQHACGLWAAITYRLIDRDVLEWCINTLQ